MAEFISSNEKTVDVGDPVFFENKTDSDYEVSAGIIFKKSGVYEVSIVGNRTCVTKVTERKRGKWIHGREVSREKIGDAVTAIFYEGWECSECHALVEDGREPLWNYCPNCGADMRGEQK